MTSALVDLRWSQGQPAGVGLYIQDLALALSKHLPLRGLARPGARPAVPFPVTVLPDVPNFRFDLLESWVARRSGAPLITLSRVPIMLAHRQAMPIIFDLSPLIVPQTHPAFRGFLERSSYPVAARARTIITISQTSRRDLIDRLSVSPERICVVRPGRPISQAPAANPERLRQLGIHSDFVLNVGTLEPRKNVATLIDAFAGPLRDLSLQLVVAGGRGWKDQAILERMADLRQSGRMVYLGYVSESDKALLYRHAMCLAYPSLYEGFGLPILEAMTYGIPAVVSTAPACMEVIGSAGIVLPATDAVAWADALKGLWLDPGRRAQLGRLGQERSGQFTWERSVRPLVDLLTRSQPAAAAAA